MHLQNELNEKYGANKVRFIKGDVTNEDHLMGAFDAILKDYGYVDVVVNNAGIMNDSKEMYKKEIEVNLVRLYTVDNCLTSTIRIFSFLALR